MKQIIPFLLILASISSCEKPCQEYGASDMVGTYQNSAGVFMDVSTVAENRIRIDDNFSGSITECGEIDVIEQTYQHPITNNDITVSGTMEFKVDNPTNVNGQLTGGGKKIVSKLVFITQGQTIPDNSTYYFQ